MNEFQLSFMFPGMKIESSLCPKRSNASRMRTDQLVHFSMDHHEVVDHPLVVAAVDAAVGTNRFADEQLQMRQKMQSIFVVAAVEFPVANAA